MEASSLWQGADLQGYQQQNWPQGGFAFGTYDGFGQPIMAWNLIETQGPNSGTNSLPSMPSAHVQESHSFSNVAKAQPSFPTNVQSAPDRTLRIEEAEAQGIQSPTSDRTIEHAHDEISRAPVCSECHQAFGTLRALDKHTQSTSHKAWTCSAKGCGKSYARRDTFLRHRSTHKDSNHSCITCLMAGKQKVFKRKDHLREHMRNCHSRDADNLRSVIPKH